MPYYRTLLASDINREIYQDTEGRFQALVTFPTGLTTHLLIKKSFSDYYLARSWAQTMTDLLLYTDLLLSTSS